MELQASWYSDGEWRGYVPHEQQSYLRDRHMFVTPVAGFGHYPDAVQRTDFDPGRVVLLRPEPENAYDSRAIGIWNADGSVRAGYVPALILRQLADSVRQARGLALGEMLEGDERRALWVLVARGPVKLILVEAGSEQPAIVSGWVRQAKKAMRRSKDWGALKLVDPLEQMRTMADDSSAEELSTGGEPTTA